MQLEASERVCLPTGWPSWTWTSWRSAAGANSRRLHELAGDLRSAVRLVEAALDAVYGAISTLTGG
jgi:hypothetical protein